MDTAIRGLNSGHSLFAAHAALSIVEEVAGVVRGGNACLDCSSFPSDELDQLAAGRITCRVMARTRLAVM